MPRTLRTLPAIVVSFITVLTIVTSSSAQNCSTPSFTQPPVYQVGSDVRGQATADFDSDGHADVAVVDVNSDSVTVFMKLAQDTPVVTNSYAIGRFPLKVAAGDFNSDSKPDLITINSSSFNMSLLVNDGTGHFTLVATPPTLGQSFGITLGDFNGDTKLDVAVANSSQSIVVQLGDGNAGFGTPKVVNTGIALNQIVNADFTGDGKLDLAVTTTNSPARIYVGDGAGNFALSGTCSLTVGGVGIAAGDLNGDAKPDLVLGDVLASRVHVLLNNGTGCFGAPSSIDFGVNIDRPRYVTLGDMTGDSKLDIVAHSSVVVNNGSGGFGTPLFFPTGSAAEPGSNSVVADFDGDGKLDIATSGSKTLSLLLGDGMGGMIYSSGPGSSGVFAAVARDMNGDGKVDLVYSRGNSANIKLGDGNSRFSAPTSVSVTNASIQGAVVADFNGDTKLDFAGFDSSNSGPNGQKRLFIFPGDGQGGLGAPTSTNFTASEPRTIAGGDFNGDSKFDLLTLNQNSISVFLGDGLGQFAAPTQITVGASVNPKQVGVADFNGDGKLDLAVPSGGSFTILIGNGAGSFTASAANNGAQADSIAVADFNADGKPDLAMTTSSQTDNLAVALGDGSGGFGPITKLTIGTFSSDVTTGDFNGDNKIDIAAASNNLSGTPSTVSVLLGNGNGGFGSKTDYTVGNPNRILAADFNADSKTDLITVNTTFAILVNTCGAPLGITPTVQFSSQLFSVSEDANMATITVVRGGDSSTSVAVKYATSDGVASSRTDYTSAFGTLRFAPGELSKTFNVLIINDLKAGEASESLNLTLSFPVGATLGNPISAILAIQDNDPTFVNTNPIDLAEFFVRQHYFDFLNRVPDASGLQFWTNEITQCESLPVADRPACREVKRINVSAAFFLSIEFQQTGYFVHRTYKTAYGDKTSPNVPGTVPVVRFNELLGDSQELGLGVVVGEGNWEQQLDANKTTYLKRFVTEQRFLTAFPINLTPEQFVDRLNLNAGNVLAQLERDQLIMQLSGASDQTVGRAAVLGVVAENNQLRQNEFNRAFVLMQYFGYLRRNPDDSPNTDFSGWKFWLDKLNEFNGNFANAELVKAFLVSSEYRSRFDSTPEN